MASGALAVAAATPTLAAPRACVLQKVAELDVVAEPVGPVVLGQIDGKPVRFLLDTGSSFSALFTPAAERLGLRGFTSKVQLYGVGGEGGAQEVTVRNWQLGSLSAASVNLVLLPSSHTGSIDGILGSGLLLNHDVEFDLKNGKVRLFMPKDCSGDQVVYWGQAYSVAPIVTPGGYAGLAVFVPVQVGGLTIKAMMDTGSTRSALETEIARRAGAAFAANSEHETSYGVGRAGLGLQAVRIGSFAFGEEAIRNTQLMAGQLFAAETTDRTTGSHFASKISDNQPQMLLGYDFFRAHRVYIAMSQQKVYASYEGGSVFDTSAAPAAAATHGGAPSAASAH
jgi:predicted aspartyl protease